MTVVEKILQLSRQLYPTGRAFKMPFGGDFERLNKALAASESRAYSDALSILNSALPDNDAFTGEDATDWEKRLRLISNPAVPLADRKLALQRKMAHPGKIPARGNYRYVEGQLQAAGFAGVYVFENIFPDGGGGFMTRTPVSFTGGNGFVDAQYGDFQYGDFQYGKYWSNIVANHIEENLDNNFNIGMNLRSTFFIGGTPVGTYANVPASRKEEFRQLILRTKHTQEIAFLFINYV